jgi:hypothetical protein
VVVRAVVCVEWEAAHLTRVYWVVADLAAAETVVMVSDVEWV